MNFENKIILIISPNDWDYVKVSKHHYALELAKRNKVYFLNPPGCQLEDNDSGSVIVIRNYKRVRGISKVGLNFISKWLMGIEVKSILKQIEGKLDIVWSFDTSRLYFLDLFKATLKIAHIVDYNENIKLIELVSSCDVSFATSDSIISKIEKHQDKIFKINHGYVQSKLNEIIELPGNNKVKAVYIGNLNISYLDWDSVSLLVTNFRHIDFIFYGPIDSENFLKIKKLTEYSNFIIEDYIIHEKVNNYLVAADICLQIYNAEQHYNQLQNPHKTMQYLGSGNPVFSSLTHEYIDKGLLTMYDKKEDLMIRFQDLLDQIEVFSIKKTREFRKSFANDNTYSKQILRIEIIINSKIIRA